MKTFDYRLGLAAIALIVAGCDKKAETPAGGTPTAAAGPVAANAPAGGWTETATTTPEGGFLLGNPAAPVKLVEYSSMTCPHCAAFSTEAMPALKANYIASGKVSLEMRNFVRDPVDLAAALIARCNGAPAYFKMTEQLYASQMDWIGNFQKLTPADQSAIGNLPQDKQYAALAKAGGLDRFAEERGLPADKVAQCLGNLKERDLLVEMNRKAVEDIKLEGTPTFLINGQLVQGAYDWASLEPKLKAAVGS
ncbi:DsbA family protein [Sphingomonas quercus]|uniref:DsbA family protein n=1 Tax=Sphingomonas quercus TaxID=2842451 RepID=A0ABS6BK36_9SPHN|nr:DsbA family protein [Sphingomonas quercus]